VPNPVEFACRNQVIVSGFVLEVQHLDPVRGAARPDGMVPLISDGQGQVVVEDVLRDETQALAKGDTTSVIYCCGVTVQRLGPGRLVSVDAEGNSLRVLERGAAVVEVGGEGDRLSPGTLFPVLVDWILFVFAKITHEVD